MLGRRLNDLLAVIGRDGQAPSDMTKDEAKHLRDEGLVELPPDQSQIFDIKAGVEPSFEELPKEWRILRLTPNPPKDTDRREESGRGR